MIEYPDTLTKPAINVGCILHNKEWSNNQNSSVVALMHLGSQLLRQGQESFSLRMFDAALLVRKSPMSLSSLQVQQQIQWAEKKLKPRIDFNDAFEENLHYCEEDSPDVYREDECDVGPRPFRIPIVPPSDIVVENYEPIFEACLLYNKALAYQCGLNHDDAAKLYREVTDIVLEPQFNHYEQQQNGICRILQDLALRSHNNLGRISYMESNEDQALSHFKMALSIAKKLWGQSQDMCADFATVLSNYCRISWMKGDRSDHLYRGLSQVLHVRSCHLGCNHIDVASAHHNLGFAEYARGRYEEAAFHLTEYIHICSIQTKCNGVFVSDIDPIPALIVILLMKNEGKGDEIISRDLVNGLRLLQQLRESLGPHDCEVAAALNFVGKALYKKKDFDNALFFFLEELRIEEELDDSEDSTYSITSNNIGKTLQELQRFPEAVEYYTRALKNENCQNDIDFNTFLDADEIVNNEKNADEKCKERQSWSMELNSNIWFNLGVVYEKMGSYHEALRAFEKSLLLRKAVLGPTHPDVLCLLHNISVLQLQQKLLEEATISIHEMIEIKCTAFQAGVSNVSDQNIIRALQKLAHLHKCSNNIQASIDVLREAYIIQQNSSEIEPAVRTRDMGVTLIQIADLYHEQEGGLYLALVAAKDGVALLKSLINTQRESGGAIEAVPHSCCAELVDALLLLGGLAQEISEPVVASSIFMEALDTINEYCKENQPHSYLQSIRKLREIAFVMATSHCAPIA